MNDFITFLLVFEAGLDIRRCPASPNVTRFQFARKSGYSDDPADPGGATMCGVTLKTYSEYCRKKGFPAPDKEALKNIPFSHWKAILKENFWDLCRADDLVSRSVAYLIVDWVWASGPKVIKNVQRIVGVKADGIIGPKTVAAVNDSDQRHLFGLLQKARTDYIEAIIFRNKTLEKYRRGWLRRLSAISFDGLSLS